MKKIFALCAALAVFSLVLTGCPDDFLDDDDVTGTWRYSGTQGNMTLEIDKRNKRSEEGHYSCVYGTYSTTGSWTRHGTVLTMDLGTATLFGGELELVITYSYFPKGTYNLTRSGTTAPSKTTTLKIKNESFTEITDVIWQDVSFANDTVENSIKTGTTVTQTVSQGLGYIFFKRNTNPIIARTKDVVIVGDKENIEFTFTDNTVIVEVNNIINTGTLGALQTSVVFFDDAEGEMQPYFEKQSFVGYYKTESDITASTSSNYFVNTPKNGNTSIAVGGTNTAKLHLKIDLAKPAKLSFWVANKWSTSAGTAFSINGVVKETWKTDLDWSFKTYTLEAGQNDIIWEKNDGYSSNYYYYLSLDDILIYYTE